MAFGEGLVSLWENAVWTLPTVGGKIRYRPTTLLWVHGALSMRSYKTTRK